MTQVCQPKKNSLNLQPNYTVASEAQLQIGCCDLYLFTALTGKGSSRAIRN
jgi:hypothetical protein